MIAPKIIPMLSPRRASMLRNAIGILEDGVARLELRASHFNDAKDSINRAVEEAAEAYLALGRKTQTPDGMSDDWHAAYEANAFVHGAHNLPSALKRAQSDKRLKRYADFLGDIMPLADLVKRAKPLVKKRDFSKPAPLSPIQQERMLKTMTCQCCGMRFLANLGKIAHHGYQRPGTGWQTASCIGARELPFEVSRDALGEFVKALKRHLKDRKLARAAIDAETAPISRSYRETAALKRTSFDVTRKTWKQSQESLRKGGYFYTNFDALKQIELANRDSEIKATGEEIARQQARFDNWKQTHYWHPDKLWVEYKGK